MRERIKPNTKNCLRTNGRACLMACAFLVLFTSKLQASSLEQAKQLHDRIVGVPASETMLNEMSLLLDNGKAVEAAYKAMESPHFYTTTLKLLATPWTNEEHDVFAPLNDYTATFIGIVRDDVDFRQILQGDLVYIGKNDFVTHSETQTLLPTTLFRVGITKGIELRILSQFEHFKGFSSASNTSKE